VLALLETSTSHLTDRKETPAMSNEKYEARKAELEPKHRPALKRELSALLKPLKGKHLQAALATFKPEEDWPADDDDARKKANGLALRTPQEEMVEALLAIQFPAETQDEEEVEEVEEKPKPKRGRAKKAAPKKEAVVEDDSALGSKVAELGVVLNDIADFMESERKARIEFEGRVALALVVIANDASTEEGYGDFDELVAFGKELTSEG
jgi:hypothetical protein